MGKCACTQVWQVKVEQGSHLVNCMKASLSTNRKPLQTKEHFPQRAEERSGERFI